LITVIKLSGHFHQVRVRLHCTQHQDKREGATNRLESTKQMNDTLAQVLLAVAIYAGAIAVADFRARRAVKNYAYGVVRADQPTTLISFCTQRTDEGLSADIRQA
jgi:hypothetical protein